jgi:Tetratricopeptide repeat
MPPYLVLSLPVRCAEPIKMVTGGDSVGLGVARWWTSARALTAALAEVLRRDGPWTEAITRHTTALQSACHLGDRLGQASTLTDLGNLRRLTDDYHGAARDLGQALAIYRDLSDRLGPSQCP